MSGKYLLETEAEFERLERQSATAQFDYKEELSDFRLPAKGLVLDAGCGSGIVSRYLAQANPHLSILGVDASRLLLNDAMHSTVTLKNLRFEPGDLTQLAHPELSVDGFICRYVMQHMTLPARRAALKELHRVTRPGAKGCVIDIDGFIFNLHPQSPRVADALTIIRDKAPFDFYVGRKLPEALSRAGFADVRWRIQCVDLQGSMLEAETSQFEQRFRNARPVLNTLLGGSREARLFIQDFLRGLSRPEAVLFYNKFIVTGCKPGLRPV